MTIRTYEYFTFESENQFLGVLKKNLIWLLDLTL